MFHRHVAARARHDMHFVGHAVFEVVFAADAERIAQGHVVGKAGVLPGEDPRMILHAEDVGARRKGNFEVRAAAAPEVVEAHLRGIACGDGDRPAEGNRGIIVGDVDMQAGRTLVGAIAAEAALVEVVPDMQRIGKDAGVHRVVAQNRNVHPVVTVRPDVEIRGVVLSEIDRIGENPVALSGSDQQAGCIRGSVVGILLPLVGDGCHRSLLIGQQVEFRGGLPARKRSYGSVRIVVGIVGRCGVRNEERHGGRHGAQTDGSELYAGGLYRDIAGDLRRTAFDLDSREPYDTACRGGNVERHVAGHRQHVPVVGMRDPQIVPCGSVAQVGAHVGRNAQAVGVRNTFEADGCVVLEPVLDYGVIGIAEPPVHVAQRLVVRRTGRDSHLPRAYRKLRHDGFKAGFHRSTVTGDAAQAESRKQRDDRIFHGAWMKKGFPSAKGREPE